MFQLLKLRHGAILNRRHGTETADGLTIEVEGLCDTPGKVTVNGAAARRDQQTFRALVRLTKPVNEIVAETHGAQGTFRQSLQVLWDRASFRRYGFNIDDNVFFLTDLAKQKPASLFDHFYLAGLRRLHHTYGAKFVLNAFYRNDHHPFELTDFPDCWKGEWKDNADWLRLAFHAYSEFPDRPYQSATAEQLASDYDLLRREVVRFAGEATFEPTNVIHWAMVPPDCLHVLRDRGVKVLGGQFLRTKTRVDEPERAGLLTDIGYFQNEETSVYLSQRRACHDFDLGITWLMGNVTCNLLRPAEILQGLQTVFDDPAQDEYLFFITHEQYTFPSYKNHLPDHFERMETAVRAATERGYKAVFINEGLLGNTSWPPESAVT